MIVCNRCGKENQDHYKFCLGCGAELTAPAKGEAGMAMMKTMMADSPGAPPRPLPGLSPAPAQTAPPNLPPPNLPPPPGYPPAGPPLGMKGMSSGPLGGSLPPPASVVPGTQPPPYGAAPMGAPPSGPPPAGPPPGVPGATASGPSYGTPTPAAGPRRCPQCGSDVPPGFRFCGACGCRMDEASQPNIAPVPTAGAPTPRAQPRALMTLIRPDGSEGGTHELRHGDNKIGRNFGPVFETDGYLSPLHAEILVNGTAALVRDLDSLNGVFVKMTEEEELVPGQILRIGQELLRFDLVLPPEPIADGTEVMGSPNPGYWGKLTVIIGRNVDGSAFPLLGDAITLGRERGEINFPDDGYVSGLHARVTNRDGRVFLADLGSSNGTFVKVAAERELQNESFVLMGQQLFRLNLTA